MKLIAVIMGLMLFMIVLLTYKIFSIESDIQALNILQQSEKPNEVLDYRLNTPRDSISANVPLKPNLPVIDYEKLRAIVKEELIVSLEESYSSSNKNRLPEEKNNPESYEYASIQVEQFLSQGQINSGELENFHANHPNLSMEQRRELFGKLARAVNSGNLKVSIH
jgi:hypothetical protein